MAMLILERVDFNVIFEIANKKKVIQYKRIQVEKTNWVWGSNKCSILTNDEKSLKP